jgi:hypothetical protein
MKRSEERLCILLTNCVYLEVLENVNKIFKIKLKTFRLRFHTKHDLLILCEVTASLALIGRKLLPFNSPNCAVLFSASPPTLPLLLGFLVSSKIRSIFILDSFRLQL